MKVTISEAKANLEALIASLPNTSENAVRITDEAGKPAALLISVEGLATMLANALTPKSNPNTKALLKPMDAEDYEAFRRRMLDELDPMAQLEALFKDDDDDAAALEELDKVFKNQNNDLEELEKVFGKENKAH